MWKLSGIADDILTGYWPHRCIHHTCAVMRLEWCAHYNNIIGDLKNFETKYSWKLKYTYYSNFKSSLRINCTDLYVVLCMSIHRMFECKCSPLREFWCLHVHNILIGTVMNLYSILVQNSLSVMRGSDRQFWIGVCSMVSLILDVLATILEPEVCTIKVKDQARYLCNGTRECLH